MPGESNDNPNWGKYVGLGLEMAIGVTLGYFVGAWLDKKYGWTPNGALVGSLLGLAGGMYLLIKQAVQMNADPKPKAPAPTSPPPATSKRNDDQ